VELGPTGFLGRGWTNFRERVEVGGGVQGVVTRSVSFRREWKEGKEKGEEGRRNVEGKVEKGRGRKVGGREIVE